MTELGGVQGTEPVGVAVEATLTVNGDFAFGILSKIY